MSESVWTFEASVDVRSSRAAAWAYWSNVDNWARVDPAVEWARIEGPFVAGAHGQTKPVGSPAIDWSLREVVDGERAVIEIVAPGAIAQFTWTLGDRLDGGAVLSQEVRLTGADTPGMADVTADLERGIPAGMRALAAAIDGAHS